MERTVPTAPIASVPGQGESARPGDLIAGRYRIEVRLGAGATGEVFEATRLPDGLRVAVKLLRGEHLHDEVQRHRFLREARATSMIRHPNVVEFFDFGVTGEGRPFMAMEFLEGEDLATYLRRLGRLSWRQSCALLQQVASGLSAAHACGVIHRDVKPSNILLVNDTAGGARAKVVDFGVAKVEAPVVSRVLTRVDDMLGTVLYMSPEQAQGDDADARSDIYSLGITAYQLATGQVPFLGRDIFEVLAGHLAKMPVPPIEVVRDFPPQANALILRCLAKRREDRYQSILEVVNALATDAPPDAISLPPAVATRVGPAPTGPAPRVADEEAPTGYFFRPVPVAPPPPLPPPPVISGHTMRVAAVSMPTADDGTGVRELLPRSPTKVGVVVVLLVGAAIAVGYLLAPWLR